MRGPGQGIILREWLHESAWTFLGTLLSRGSAFALSVAAARLLRPADFAVFAIAQNFQVALTVLFGFGFASAMARYVGQAWAAEPESGVHVLRLVWRWAILTAVIMALGLSLAAGPVAAAVFGSTGAWWIVCLCAVSALASSQVGTLSCAYAAIVQMRRYSVLVSRTSLVMLPILIGVAISGSLTLLFAGWGLSFLVTAGFLGWVLWRQLLKTADATGAERSPERPPGLPAFVIMAGAANVLVYPMHAIVLGLIRSRHGNEEAAVFQICVLWMTLLTLVPGTLANNLLAAAARGAATSDSGLDLRRSALRVMIGLAAAISLFGITGAPVIAAVYGPVMEGYWSCLAVISIAAAATTLTNGIWPTLMVTQGAQSQLLLNGVFAVTYVLAAVFLAPGRGALGAAVACAGAALLQWLVALAMLRAR